LVTRKQKIKMKHFLCEEKARYPFFGPNSWQNPPNNEQLEWHMSCTDTSVQISLVVSISQQPKKGSGTKFQSTFLSRCLPLYADANRNYKLPMTGVYEGCPESIQPFWITRETVAWPWCNLADRQRRPYCISVNSPGASQSAVRRRWLILCIVWPSRSQISYLSTAILALRKAGSRREPNLGCRGADRAGWWDALIYSLSHCECDGHTVHKLSQRRLTADWLAPWESDCSRMQSKVSSDWLPSYIKATWPVLDIFKMAGYFPDSPRQWAIFNTPCFKHAVCVQNRP